MGDVVAMLELYKAFISALDDLVHSRLRDVLRVSGCYIHTDFDAQYSVPCVVFELYNVDGEYLGYSSCYFDGESVLMYNPFVERCILDPDCIRLVADDVVGILSPYMRSGAS